MAALGRPTDELKRQQRRTEILDAASELIDLHGLEGLTMQDVVERARTSIGNLYFYFPNKDALLTALVTRFMERVRSEADRVTQDIQPGWTEMACSIYVLVDALLVQRELAKLMISGGPYAHLRESTFAYFRAGLRHFFRTQSQSTGNVSDPDWLAVSVLGSFVLLLENVLSGRLESDTHQLWSFMLQWSMTALGMDQHDIDQIMEESIWMLTKQV